ncbi:DUF4238 domain-containing protein (plasmid) [Fibrella sp. USSR17]
MHHPNQDQHKVPQVYLKQFGYVDANKQWKVSVKERNEPFTRQKSIKSFTAKTNVFDLDSNDPTIIRIFEKLNCDLENGYPAIISELESGGMLSDKSYAFLLQLIANLLVRTDQWRDVVLSLLNSSAKAKFLQFITGHHCENEQAYKAIQEQPFYRRLIECSPEEALNRTMLYFMDHLMLRLWNYEIVIIQSQADKEWWTSTNPVITQNKMDGMEIFTKESEFYFPISPKYLAYLHCKASANQNNPLRSMMSNQVYTATDEQNVQLQHLILENSSEFIIIKGEFTYRKELNSSF